MVLARVESRPGFFADGSIPVPVYLGAALVYPWWNLLAPAHTVDPWWVWWAVGAAFLVAAGATLGMPQARRLGPHLLAGCTALVTLHLFTLASLNQMQPFYAVGSALAVVTASFSIRSGRVLLAYGGFVTLIGVAFYIAGPDPRKIAYWGGMLPVVGLAYERLSAQLAASEAGRRQNEELELRVEERTRDLEAANRRLRGEMEERARLEEQLRLAQTMEVVGQLAGGIAHEFNNLLTTMRLYTEILLDQLSRESPLRNEVKRIQKAGREAAALTQQLLDLSRDDDVEPHVLDLDELIRGNLPMLRRLAGEKVELACLFHGEGLAILADRGEVERILVNLVVNARDAMPWGGRIVIETDALSRDQVSARGHPVQGDPGDESAWVQLVVSDTGTGMDADTQARAFDPFFTRKPVGKGSGLGLSIVYRIVRQAGGAIRVISEPGEGTSFELVWPRATQEPRSPEERKPLLGAARGNERILLVEDEPDVREALSRVLRSRGYEVLEAADAAGALRLLGDLQGAVDLLASDVVMPGMSGVELVERVGEHWPGIRALLLSGYVDHPSLEGRPLPPGLPLLRKPFEAADLTARIREVLDGPPARPDGGPD